MADSVIFSHVMEEYGSQDKDEEDEKEDKEEKTEDDTKKAGKKAGLMQAEERMTGSVSTMVYVKYLRYAGGVIWAPIIVLMLIGYQGSQGTHRCLSSF